MTEKRSPQDEQSRGCAPAQDGAVDRVTRAVDAQSRTSKAANPCPVCEGRGYHRPKGAGPEDRRPWPHCKSCNGSGVDRGVDYGATGASYDELARKFGWPDIPDEISEHERMAFRAEIELTHQEGDLSAMCRVRMQRILARLLFLEGVYSEVTAAAVGIARAAGGDVRALEDESTGAGAPLHEGAVAELQRLRDQWAIAKIEDCGMQPCTAPGRCRFHRAGDPTAAGRSLRALEVAAAGDVRALEKAEELLSPVVEREGLTLRAGDLEQLEQALLLVAVTRRRLARGRCSEPDCIRPPHTVGPHTPTPSTAQEIDRDLEAARAGYAAEMPDRVPQPPAEVRDLADVRAYAQDLLRALAPRFEAPAPRLSTEVVDLAYRLGRRDAIAGRPLSRPITACELPPKRLIRPLPDGGRGVCCVPDCPVSAWWELADSGERFCAGHVPRALCTDPRGAPRAEPLPEDAPPWLCEHQAQITGAAAFVQRCNDRARWESGGRFFCDDHVAREDSNA